MDANQWKRIISMILYSLMLGVPGCGMALSDLGGGRTILDWVFLGAAYFFFAGFMLGLIEPSYWYLSFVAAWGQIAMTAIMLLFFMGRHPFNPATPIVPLLFSIIGGYLGSAARGRIGAK